MKLAALAAVVILCCLAAVLLCWRSPAARCDLPTRLAILTLVAIFLGYFATVLRGTGAENRTGDLDVYLRAVRAAREGESLYQTTSPQGWPLLQSLHAPFSRASQAPAGHGPAHAAASRA